MEGLAPLTSRLWSQVQAAYEKISTAEARAIHDDAVRQREREKAAQRAQDAAATAQAVQPAEQPKKSDTSSAGDARFVNRETWKWMMKKQKEADAQRERILAAQKKREEDAQKDKKRRDQEAALRDRNKPKAPAQTKDSDGGTASHEQNQPKSEPKSETKSESRSESRSESAPGQRAGHTKGTEEKGGAASARKPTVNRDPESLRVAILRFRPGTTVPDVVDRLASSSVGAVADIHIMESGVAKIDFFRADSARKLQHLIRGGNFTVNGEKVKGMALQVSGLPMPQDPLASRVLMLTDPRQVMPVLGSEYVKFILRQDYHICPWVAINTLSVTRTEVHFRSWREAEKVTQILESHFPGIHVRYAIDPATGDKEPPRSLLVSVFTARDLPNSKFVRVLRRLFTLVGLYISCNALLVFYGQ